MKSFVYER